MGQDVGDGGVQIRTWLQVEPDRLEDFQAVMRVFAEDVRTFESGCLFYRVVYAVHDPTEALVLAAYASMEDYYAHISAPHTTSIMSILDPMLVGAPKIDVVMQPAKD